MTKPVLPSSLLDAWVGYAIDPRRYEQLVAELDSHAPLLETLDPSDFLASFSEAEALSWRIRSAEGSAPGGFAYVLLDAQDRVLSRHDESRLLDVYLDPPFTAPRSATSEDGAEFDALLGEKLCFAEAETQAHWLQLKNRVVPLNGHLLMELRDSNGERARYGYVINRADFPANLAALSDAGERALLLPETNNNPSLRKTLQSSFGLSEAETDITLALASGQTLKEAAIELRVSINTVRNQLQSVFTKSGISRQSELILVVTQLGIIVATHPLVEQTVQAPAAERRDPGLQPALEILVLPDGRQLAYRRYGAVDGKPVLYLHESFGCGRLPARTHEMAIERNLLIVAPDRPGYGFSHASSTSTISASVADLRAFLVASGLTNVTLCGYLSGAGYALELAHNPGVNVSKIMLVAGRVPSLNVDETGGRGSRANTPLQRFRRSFMQQPWLLNSFFNVLRNRSSPALFSYMLQRAYGSNKEDQALFDRDPELLEFLVANCVESQSVSSAGVANDMRAFALGSQRQAKHLTIPITVWHGTEDQVADPVSLQRYLRGCRVVWRDFPGEGAMVFYRHYDAWLDELSKQY